MPNGNSLTNFATLKNALPQGEIGVIASGNRPVKVAKSRKLKSSKKEAPAAISSFNFAQNMIPSFAFTSTKLDPLQCHEKLEDPTLLQATNIYETERELTQFFYPLVQTSVVATSAATPVKTTGIRSIEEVLNKVSETLLLQISNSTLGLMIDAKPAFQIRNTLCPEDVPCFNSSFDMWLNDVETEELISQYVSPDCLDRHKDITSLNRWMVLNWIRDVVIDINLYRFAWNIE